MPQSGNYPSTFNAIASGKVNIVQDPADLLTVGIRSGTAEIGTVCVKPSNWSNVLFSTIGVNILAATAANTWVDGIFEQTYYNCDRLKLIPLVTSTGSVANTSVDLRFQWSGDGTPQTRSYIVNETLGTASGGLISVTQNIKYWTIGGNTLGVVANPIIIPVEGVYLKIQARRNQSSTTLLSIDFNGQTK